MTVLKKIDALAAVLHPSAVHLTVLRGKVEAAKTVFFLKLPVNLIDGVAYIAIGAN